MKMMRIQVFKNLYKKSYIRNFYDGRETVLN